MLYFLVMKSKSAFLSVLFVSLLLVTLTQTGLVNAVLANSPVSGPVSRPISTPVVTPIPSPVASPSATPRPVKPTPTPIPVKLNHVAGSVYYKIPATFKWNSRTYTYYYYSPASNIQIRLVNTKTSATYLARTNRWGIFNVGVVKGTYTINASDSLNSVFQPNNFTINIDRSIRLFFSAVRGR